MFTLAFFAMLRPSELVQSPASPQHQLQREDIVLQSKNLEIHFQLFKHSSKPVTVKIPKIKQSITCPWTNVRAYIAQQSTSKQALFQMTTSEAKMQLQKCLTKCGICLPLTLHSLRRGGATRWSEHGLTDAKLRVMGRWHSNAYLEYVKA
jgi:integrase